MSDHSAIEWTDATWSPSLGCDKVSPGCQHCYAINTAYRQEFGFKRSEYQGLTRKLPDGSLNWTGAVRSLNSRLHLPITWREPRRIFVDSMSDLFHDDVDYGFIAAVFGVMLATPRHTFQVLTKRPERMRDFMLAEADRVWGSSCGAWCAFNAFARVQRNTPESVLLERTFNRSDLQWPPPNVWLGTSVEDQQRADERIPLLLQTPAVVRFLSCEPLLGPVSLRRCLELEPTVGGGWMRWSPDPVPPLSWVIAGGESGPNFRPMDLDWARTLRDQCQAAGVAFHFKQIGGRTHAAGGRQLDGRTWDEFPSMRETVPA